MSVPATEAVTPTPPGMYTPAPTAQAGGDKDMFLQLLVAQLRYQDPMNPADSTQFLSQNAQFTALEKMQDVADQTAALLNSQVAFGSASLVGKQVTWLDDNGASTTGTVSGVTFTADGPRLEVDGSEVTLAQIQSIGTGTPGLPATTSTDSTTPATSGSPVTTTP